jgi:Na+/melibiose symporter-like transporter
MPPLDRITPSRALDVMFGAAVATLIVGNLYALLVASAHNDRILAILRAGSVLSVIFLAVMLPFFFFDSRRRESEFTLSRQSAKRWAYALVMAWLVAVPAYYVRVVRRGEDTVDPATIDRTP